MKKSRIAVLLAAGLLMGAGTVAMAFGGSHHGDFGCRHGAGPMQQIEQLEGLSAEQRSSLEGLYAEQRASMKQQRLSMRESHQAVRDAIANGADSAQIQQLADQQGQRVAQLIVTRAQMQQKLAEILTPEQQAQLEQLREERRGRWMGKHHGGGHPGMGM